MEETKGIYKNDSGKMIGLFMGSFPKKLALEWEKDCHENYGGCRWMKAYSDHCKSRQLEIEEFAAEALSQQETEEKPKEEEIPTLGGGKKDE